MGINTETPQRALHIAGATGTLRIESLNHVNNSYNGGDTEEDGDLTNNIFPLYVDENGDFTLELKVPINSEDTDAFDDINLPTSSVILTANDTDGIAITTIKSYSITASRPSILAVTYGISFDIYLNTSKVAISDNMARRAQTYINVDQRSRKYAPATKAYSSGYATSVKGSFYNSCTAYINLPTAGIYTIKFMGLVDSGIKSGGPGTISKATYVEFATGDDFVFMRLY